MEITEKESVTLPHDLHTAGINVCSSPELPTDLDNKSLAAPEPDQLLCWQSLVTIKFN